MDAAMGAKDCSMKSMLTVQCKQYTTLPRQENRHLTRVNMSQASSGNNRDVDTTALEGILEQLDLAPVMGKDNLNNTSSTTSNEPHQTDGNDDTGF